MSLLKAALPVLGFPARVGDRKDLNAPFATFAINHDKGELSEQEPAGVVRAEGPSVGRSRDPFQRSTDFRIKTECRFRDTLKVPIKCGVVFRPAWS